MALGDQHFRPLLWLSHSSWARTPALKLLQKIPRHSFLCLWYFPPAIQVSDGVLTSLPKPAPVTGRTSASKTGNAQPRWAYPSFLQRFRPLLWLSHSIVELGRVRGCPFRKVERSASWSFHLFLQGISLTSLSQTCSKRKASIHFTKVQEILFKNFCSLSPVAIAVRSVSELQI